MPTQTEAIQTIRDAAHLNQHALELVLAEARENFQAVRFWPDSPAKRALLNNLNDTITTLDAARREQLDLRATADDALQSQSVSPVPLPAYGDIASSAVWSRKDW